MRRAVFRLLLALLLATAGACGADGSGGGDAAPVRTLVADGEAVPVAPLEEAARALCAARDQAASDVMAARATFYDRSHDALHTLARALGPVDRALAARLLEDKQRVEADFERAASPGDLAADLDRLASVTRLGLAALAVEVAACR